MAIKHCKKPGPQGEPHLLCNISEHFIHKFHDRIQIMPNGCHFLKGNVQNSGYINWWYKHEGTDGEIRTRWITAHRFAALTSGKFSEQQVNDYCVLHDCDQHYETNDITYRQCVNVNHLKIGTVQDNIKDCINKGRYIKPPIQLGEDNNNATITTKQAEWIIENHYVIPQRRIAEILNISPSTVQAIHMNKTWRHLDRTKT